ncbi:MAG: hypothetical protein DI536_29020 [Archangium gephyra]|uniref:Uncharacterized protein n=1 Tax=Archangium gephyra TaxID=48 RepID=A0A2W5VAD7_9BACT|nr:MAG: hypothetical protein DI536_29020 [Archangium gephyra]
MAKKNGPPRTKLPGGMSAPIHLVEALNLVVALKTEAYEVMGSTTKVSPSDVIADALDAWLRNWVSQHGALPYSEGERADYVRKLAGTLRQELRSELSDS